MRFSDVPIETKRTKRTVLDDPQPRPTFLPRPLHELY